MAVLDSGVRAHPWLGVRKGKGYPDADDKDCYATEGDGFVQVDQVMQDSIYEHAVQVDGVEKGRRQLIRYPWDAPVATEATVPQVGGYMGHGTFIAGIFRQVVPDATVLSVRIMHSDGVVYEGDLMCALSLLAARVAKARRDGDLAALIDAVSLSFGYFVESSGDVTYTSALRQVIDLLLDMGVLVIAAAGNFATRRKFYPAALATRSAPQGLSVVSVGAQNPNGTHAAFSDVASWVHAWAPGAAIISTFPIDVDGVRKPDIVVPGSSHSSTIESLDPDDYRSGFVAWSGTSFAAPAMAASVVRVMLESIAQAPSDTSVRLDKLGAAAAIERVHHALGQLKRPV